MTYQWRWNGISIPFATQSTLTISDVQFAEQGTYSVKIFNSGGSVVSADAVLTVAGVPPIILSSPLSGGYAKNDNVTLTVSATGTAPLSYQWFLNGSPISGATNTFIFYNNIVASEAGQYYAVVSNAAGVTTSAVAIVTVSAPPFILAQPQNQTIGSGQSAVLSVSGLSKNSITYKWYFNGSLLNGITTSNLVLNNATASVAGNYKVVLANNFGSTTSSVATVTVVSPPSITSQPQSQTLLSGQNSLLGIVATNLPIFYQWNFNGQPLAGATNAVFTLNGAQITNSGNYSVTLTNVAGSVTSAVAKLTVVNPFSLAAAPNGSAGAFKIQFSLSSAATYIVYGSTNLITWIPIYTNSSPAGIVNFTDTNSSSQPQRFYRVQIQ